MSTFSFYANKLVTTGEGGMVLTDDAALAERLRSFRNLGFGQARRFLHEDLGCNLTADEPPGRARRRPAPAHR